MKCLRKISAILIVFSFLLSSLYVAGAEGVTVTLEKSVTLSSESAYHIKTGDKYLFAVTGTSKALAYEISVFDKENLSLLTKVSGKHPSTVYLNVNNIHVKGDYLYSAYVQRSGNGNPFSAKYNIKEIYEGQTLSPEVAVGMRPKAFSFMNNHILCRTDSGYGNITFMSLDNLEDISAIGISSENSTTLKNYDELYIGGNLLYAIDGAAIYVYDATDVLKGISRQDKQIYKGSFSTGGYTVTSVASNGNYFYAGTSKGVYVFDMTNPSSPVNKGTVSGTTYTKSIEINGGFMYVGRNSSLDIYNLSDAENPTLVQTVSTDSAVNEIHLREDKMYLGTNKSISSYKIEGVEISDTTVEGSEALKGEISYKQKIEGAEDIKKISVGGNKLFTLDNDENEIIVYDKDSKTEIARISEAENGEKLKINDMYTKGGFLYVSYNGIFRKYNISEMGKTTVVSEAVLPLYSDMTRDIANLICESEKYIFISATDEANRDSLANSKIFVFDKATRKYLTSIHLDSGNTNYDVAVRSMWVEKDRLYVSYNNAKTYNTYTGSLDAVVNGNARYKSPLCVYDIGTVTENAVISPKILTSNPEIANLSHPYNRGGASFADIDNSLLYQGIYTESGQNYKVYDISSSSETLKYTLKNGSKDCVRFIAEDNRLVEILQNNGGLYKAGVTSLEYNKVVVYDITNQGEAEIDLTERVCGSFETSVYGDNVIKDVALDNGKLYLATTKGIDIVDLKTMKKTGALLENKSVYSISVCDGLLFAGYSDGVNIFKGLDSEIALADEYACGAVYDMAVNEEEGKIYITSKAGNGYGEIISYKNVLQARKLENVPVLSNIDKNNAALSPSGSTANSSHMLVENDKYLFVVITREGLASNSVVQIFDKKTGELLSTFAEKTSNASRYRIVRDIYADDDVLYITWGHAWTNVDQHAFTYSSVMSPTMVYDVSNVEKGSVPSGLTLHVGGQRTVTHAPFMMGNTSYLDKEGRKFYIGCVENKNYGFRTYTVYDADEVAKCVKAGAISGLTVSDFTTGELSKNTVKFIVRDGWLYEVLQSKAGFSEYSYTTIAETLVDSSGNALNNMVRVYNIGGKTPSRVKESYENCLKGVYITEQSDAKAIKDIELCDDVLYVATTAGVEVVSLADVYKDSATNTNPAKPEAMLTLKESGAATDVEVVGKRLYAGYAGDILFGKMAQGGTGAVCSYDLTDKNAPKKVFGQEVTYGVCDISVNEDENVIYMLNDTCDTPAMTAFAYDDGHKMFSDEEPTVEIVRNGYVILENIKSFSAEVTDSKILILSGDSKEQINKILVYNAQTKLKTCEISTDAGVIPDIFAFGNYFSAYEGSELNIYSIPSANCSLADCLYNTYEASGNINSVCTDGKKLYVATDDGFDILTISSSVDSKKVMQGEKVVSVSVSGDYIYGATDSGKIFVYDTLTYAFDAETEIEEGEAVSSIAATDETIYCLTENGGILCYETNEGIVINYNVDIKTPANRKITQVNKTDGFPYIRFSERIFSDHKIVCANDKYVVTGGASGIYVFDASMKKIATLAKSGVAEMFINGDMLFVRTSSAFEIFDLSKETIEVKTVISSGAGASYTDGEEIYLYDKTALTVKAYDCDANEIFVVENCPEGITKVYQKDGMLFLVSGKTVKIYDTSEKADTTADELFLSQLTTVQNITALKAKDGYLYVSTYGGNAPSNRLYVYDLSTVGASDTIDYCSNYSTSSSEQGGGKISDFEIFGDYIVLDACDDGEMQVVSAKEKSSLYIESMIKKGANDSYQFSDVAVATNKVYAISETGGLCIYDYKCVDISDIVLESENGNVKASVKIYNEAQESVRAKLCLAVYDEKEAKMLKNLTISDISAPKGEETFVETLGLDLQNTENVTVKAILYSEENLMPLCEYSVPVLLSEEKNNVIYVDASATAGGDGSKESPYLTIQEAMEAVRKINRQMSSDITVQIAGGRYELSEPLEFTSKDGGFNGYKVIYKAKDGEKPVISGGRKIDGWTLFDSEKGIYSASAGGIETRQLYVNGEPAVRARSEGGLTKAKADSGVLGIYCYDDFLVDYKNIQDLELVFIGSFLSKRIGVSAAYRLDSSGKTLLAMNRPFWQYPNSFDTYITPVYYENALELLDKENEFYLDTKEDVLYYKPESGADISELEIVAPVLETLISINGEGLYKRVENIEFSGIGITDTTWNGPTIDGGFYPTQAGHYIVPTFNSTTLNSNLTKNAISITNADGISINSCILKNFGGNGINILTSQNVSICGNVLRDVSAGGIYVGEITKNHAKPEDERKLVRNITIENNYIDNIASEYYTSCAIALGTVQDTSVIHNEISNTPYTAVHVGWGWNSLPKRNITGLSIEYNYIHDVVKKLGDGGAIYTTGYTLADSETNPNRIANNHIGRVDGNGVFSGAAIYLDTGSSGYLITKNVIDLRESASAWIPKWGTGNSTNIFDYNYSTTVNGADIATNTFVSETAQWGEEALAIIECAGLEEAYKNLKN